MTVRRRKLRQNVLTTRHSPGDFSLPGNLTQLVGPMFLCRNVHEVSQNVSIGKS